MASARAPIGLPDRYRVDGLIAVGGMAAVYAAHDTVLDRPVAVKVLAEHLTSDDDARRRFEREARAAAALSGHPAVVTVFDVGEHEDRSFIVMERRMGGTVADALAKGPVNHDRALRWLADVAGAIDAAHERGVVHRDIKPGNLLLDEQDRVAVGDFGIATLAHEAERVTQTGAVLGSGAYLSPEQAQGVEATPASDRYALAVVAYELLTGQPPFSGTFAAQVRAHLDTDPPPAPGLPAAAQDILAQGLAKAPGDRWASATGFVRALRHALTDAPAPPRTEDTVAMRPVADVPPVPPPVSPPHPRPAEPPRERRRGPLVAALLVLAVLIAGGVALATSGGNTVSGSAHGKVLAKHRPKGKVSSTPTPPPTPVPTAAPPTPTATSTATATSTSVSTSGDASSLNARGYEALQNGDYATAVSQLSAAVKACSGSSALDPCGYAEYNLAEALIASGRSQEAIPLLRDRLARWPDDQRATVQKALDQACGTPACGAPPPGKAKGHERD